MKKLLYIIIILLPACVIAQNYNISLVPDSLLKNANAVKRFEELRVIIKSPSKAVIKHRWAITILNEGAEDFASYASTYSKIFSLNSVDGNLYDATGKQLKSVKKKDLSDIAYDDQMSLANDERLKRHNFYYRNFPYTVEYEDEKEFDGLFFLPAWQPVGTSKVSVQQSKLIVEVPSGYKLRYKQLNTSDAVVSNVSKSTVYQWSLSNLPALTYEAHQPEWDEVTPAVFLASSDFEFGGYKGNMNSWQSLGQYMNTLYAGRDLLPATIKQDIHRLIDNVSSKKEKVRILYEYLQQNTRYVSIQLGIGGWQPFDASYVATKRYGDCKALSNYMVSMLKEAGIKSNPVIINAGEGERGLFEDFPAPNFNHVIACVPDEKDTIWLECTSQTQSTGYMGTSTGNRKALMLTESGGVVVNTPRYNVEDNMQIRKVNAAIDENGNLTADVNTYSTGEQQELGDALIHAANQEQRDKYLNRVLNLPTYKIEKSDYKQNKALVPSVNEYLKITAPSYATFTGKRIFIQPNLFNKQGEKLSTDKPRKYPLKFDFAFKDVDSISIAVPAGFTVEAMPKNISLISKFGKYNMTYAFNNNKIELLRMYQRNDGTFPASDAGAAAEFFASIYQSDRGRVVLVKKD